jgi:hypothetical protein
LEDYEVRTSDSRHAGVGLGLVRRAGEMFLLVDAGVAPPFLHHRIAVPWESVAEVDHASLVVRLSVDRSRLEDVAVALDPHKAVHGPGADAGRIQLPASLTPPIAPGTERPMDRSSAIGLALFAAAAPFSLFVLITIWMTRGLEGWEYGLLAIPFVLAALTVALEGYRLFREPHVGHGASVHEVAPSRSSASRAMGRLGGRRELVVFAVGGGVLYLTTQLAITLALGETLPTRGWIGFAVASTIVLAASTILAVFLVRSSQGAGSERPSTRPPGPPGVHRILVVADEGCAGQALCSPLAARLAGRQTEVLVVAPTLVSATHYLDSDVDEAREEARARLAETVAAFEAAGVVARGEIGSESPLEAIADAVAIFAADEIVVATPPSGRTNWLERGVVERARELYDQPVSHLVVEAATPVGPRAR